MFSEGTQNFELC